MPGRATLARFCDAKLYKREQYLRHARLRNYAICCTATGDEACFWQLTARRPPAPYCVTPTVGHTAPAARCPGRATDPHFTLQSKKVSRIGAKGKLVSRIPTGRKEGTQPPLSLRENLHVRGTAVHRQTTINAICNLVPSFEEPGVRTRSLKLAPARKSVRIPVSRPPPPSVRMHFGLPKIAIR